MNNFKVNQSRPTSLLVINNIRHGRVAVGPRPAKFVAPKLMSPTILAAGRFQHLLVQRATVHMFPQALAWQLVGTNYPRTTGKSAKPIAVEHAKTLHFPAPPVFDFAPKTDRYSRHAKIQIGQVGQWLAVDVSALNHHSPPTANLLRDRIDL
jgi:hypothetical protein